MLYLVQTLGDNIGFAFKNHLTTMGVCGDVFASSMQSHPTALSTPIRGGRCVLILKPGAPRGLTDYGSRSKGCDHWQRTYKPNWNEIYFQNGIVSRSIHKKNLSPLPCTRCCRAWDPGAGISGRNGIVPPGLVYQGAGRVLILLPVFFGKKSRIYM